MKIALDWQLSSYFGWGVYGLNLALEWAGDPSIEARSLQPVRMDQIAVDPLRRRALKDFVVRSSQAPVSHNTIYLRALGNDLDGGRPGGIGLVFFEQPLTSAAAERAKWFELIITGSSWNEQLLRDAGVENVKTILQGIDPTLFHPAPRRDLFPGRFVIFSGGKAEPRKGQDLVVETFRIFARRHPEAMLVTAWHSPWPQLAAGMDLDLREFGDRVVDVGAVPNAMMAPIYRECDVGLFPNRIEGGTNLVAMECIACGVPTLLSDTSGHRDLLAIGGQALNFVGEAEVNPDEAADLLELVWWDRERARQDAFKDAVAISEFTWSRTARDLKSTVEQVYGQGHNRNVA